MAGLTREAILAAQDTDLAPVDVPEWGGVVYVRTMAGSERDEFDALLASRRKDDVDDVDMRGVKAWLVCRCVCDDAGVRLFTDEDADALGEKNWIIINRVFEAAAALNKNTADAIEEAEGN